MQCLRRYFLTVAVLVASLLNSVNCYTITVDADAEECFFENVAVDTKIGLTFEIAEGGFLDIDVTITGPDGEEIYKGERESSGMFTFSAAKSGKYTYCFSNKMSTMTPKIVMFNLEIGETAHKANGPSETPDQIKLDDMLRELATTLKTVKHEQEYMQVRVRDRIHRSINESTNSRVVLWSIFEASVLLVMTVGQVYYLKRFFEVQRVV